MQDALAIVISAVVAVAVVAAVVSLFVRSRPYEQIGRGGMAAEPPAETSASQLAEIRQMVEARNARRAARGEPPLDVDAEIARRLRERGG